MKLMITIGIVIGSSLGGWLGAILFDHGNWFGGWSILWSGIGGIAGIWVGYKAGQYVT